MLSLLELSMEVESGLKTKKELPSIETTTKNGKVRELKGTWIDIHDKPMFFNGFIKLSHMKVICGRYSTVAGVSKDRSKFAPVLPTKPSSAVGLRRSAPVLPRKPCSAGKDSWLCREHRAPCWAKCLGPREADLARVLKKPGNSSNQGHTPPAVVKCKIPLSELRGAATYYTHRAVAGRFPSTMPLHLEESFEYRFYSRSM